MWKEEPKQISLDRSTIRRICPLCHAIDPPSEPAYGCPESGGGAILSQLGGEIPDTCPWCGEGKTSSSRGGTWTEGGKGKVVYLRLECRAKEGRVKVDNAFCPGWQKVEERYYAGDEDAFDYCALRCLLVKPRQAGGNKG